MSMGAARTHTAQAHQSKVAKVLRCCWLYFELIMRNENKLFYIAEIIIIIILNIMVKARV